MLHPNIVEEIALQVDSNVKNDQILELAKNSFDVSQFNILTLNPQSAIKLKRTLDKRYRFKEINTLPFNWNQGERRLFVWFIICFLHIKQKSISELQTETNIRALSQIFYEKDADFISFQLKNIPKPIRRKGVWSAEQDTLLEKVIRARWLMDEQDPEEEKTFRNWNQVAKIMYFKSNKRIFKTPKACRERWYNHLDKTKKRGDFSAQEDLTIFSEVMKGKKCWSKIVKFLGDSRTEHAIKNRYYSLLRKYGKTLGLNDPNENTICQHIMRDVEQRLQNQKCLSDVSTKFKIEQFDASDQKSSEKQFSLKIIEKPLIENAKLQENSPRTPSDFLDSKQKLCGPQTPMAEELMSDYAQQKQASEDFEVKVEEEKSFDLIEKMDGEDAPNLKKQEDQYPIKEQMLRRQLEATFAEVYCLRPPIQFFAPFYFPDQVGQPLYCPIDPRLQYHPSQ